MKQLTLLLLFHQTLANFNINECVIDYRSLENMWEEKLVHDLDKCNYDITKSPPQNTTDPLQINIQVVLKAFKFISKEQAFTASMWFRMLWYDDRLKWNPKKYDGIESTVLMSSNIWTPGIKLVNSISQEYEWYDRDFFYSPCKVSSDGEVDCFAWEVFEVKCDTDLLEWPFDTQTCKLELGSYSKAQKLLLDFNGRAITMIPSKLGAEWDIMLIQQEKDYTSEKQLTMTFKLYRHADVLSAIVIFPSSVLSVLTLSTLFMDVRRDIRLLLICFSLMCHFNFLSELALDIPKHSKQSPRLLLYYRGSFIMTSISIVLSYALKVMCTKKTECPRWINSCNDFVYTKSVKFMIWPRWGTQAGGDASAAKVAKDWTDFTNVVNSIWIVVSIIVYLCLYCVLMPHPISYNY